MMLFMAGRVWVWAGVAITVVAVAGLGVYFALVGLDEADKLASVVGALTAVTGLAMTAFGLFGVPGGGRRVSQRATASGRGRVTQVGGSQHAPGGAGASTGTATVPGRVRQDAKVAEDGEITQVGGDQDLPGQP